MNNDQVKQFYREIAAVCTKFGVSLTGMWFEADPGDFYGRIVAADPADTRMTAICDAIADKLKDWTDEIYQGPSAGRIHETTKTPGEDN